MTADAARRESRESDDGRRPWVYRHRFEVAASQAAVADFHRRPTSLAAITPPGIGLSLDPAPALLGEGDRMRFTLRLAGLLPVPWAARISDLSPEGFIDSQEEGPFAFWQHQHRFVALGPQRTAVEDCVTARPRRHAFWGPVGLAFWAGLPLLFAFRAWKTRRLLEGRAQAQGSITPPDPSES